MNQSNGKGWRCCSPGNSGAVCCHLRQPDTRNGRSGRSNGAGGIVGSGVPSSWPHKKTWTMPVKHHALCVQFYPATLLMLHRFFTPFPGIYIGLKFSFWIRTLTLNPEP